MMQNKIKLHKLREYRNKWVHINEQKNVIFRLTILNSKMALSHID